MQNSDDCRASRLRPLNFSLMICCLRCARVFILTQICISCLLIGQVGMALPRSSNSASPLSTKSRGSPGRKGCKFPSSPGSCLNSSPSSSSPSRKRGMRPLMMSTATLREDDKQPFSDENDSDKLDWASNNLEGRGQPRKLARQHDVGFEQLDDMIVHDSIHSLNRLNILSGGSSPENGKTKNNAPILQDIARNTQSHQQTHARINGDVFPRDHPDHEVSSSSSEGYMVPRKAQPNQNIMVSDGTNEIASLKHAGGSSENKAGAAGPNLPTMFLSEASSYCAEDHATDDDEVLSRCPPKPKTRLMSGMNVAIANTPHAAHHQETLSGKKEAVVQTSEKRKNTSKITKKKAGNVMGAAALAGTRLNDATDSCRTPAKKKNGQKATIVDDSIAQAKRLLLQDSQSFSEAEMDINKGTCMSPVDDACGEVLLARHENIGRKIKKADVLMSSSQESGMLETGIVLARDEQVEEGVFGQDTQLTRKYKKKVAKVLLSEDMGAVSEPLIQKKERKLGKKLQFMGQKIKLGALQATCQEDHVMMLAAPEQLSTGEADEKEAETQALVNNRVEAVAPSSSACVSSRKSKPKVKTRDFEAADLPAVDVAVSLQSMKVKAGKTPRQSKKTQTKPCDEGRPQSAQEEQQYEDKCADVAMTSSSKARAKARAVNSGSCVQEQDANSDLTQITQNTKAKIKRKSAVEKAHAKDGTERDGESVMQKPAKKSKGRTKLEEVKAANMTNIGGEIGQGTSMSKPVTRKRRQSKNAKKLALQAAANSTQTKPSHVCNETCSVLPLDIAPPGHITVNGEETVGFRLMVVGDPVALKRPRHVFGGHTYDPNYRDKKVCTPYHVHQDVLTFCMCMYL
jgi:hypothetical protein